MKTPKIINAMNHIDDDIVLAADRNVTVARKPAWVRWVAIAAAFLFVMTGVFTVAGVTAQTSGAAVVALDVNPSMEIEIDSRERVTEVRALNAEAEQVLAEMDLKKVDLNVAVNAIIGSMLKNGYLTVDRNSILISVDAGNETRAAELQGVIAGDIEQILKAGNIEASVLSQSYAHDKAIEEKAQANQISVAKATLIEKIIAVGLTDAAGNPYTYETLAGLKVHELKLLMESKQTDVTGLQTSGTAAKGGYLPVEEIVALVEADAAEQYAAVAAGPVGGMEVELDFENGRMVYCVEFDTDTHECEYELDAKTGEIVKRECEPHGKENHHNEGHHDDDHHVLDASYLTADAAIEAALTHAGLTRENVFGLEVEVERRSGVMAYCVEFETAQFEYEYLINAKTGAVMHSEKEVND